MKKFINEADDVVDEAMEGFTACYGNYYEKHPEVNAVILKEPRKDKVALVIGGGSGHEPMFNGFVGEGLGDAAACGNVFASPDPGTIYETALAVESGKGVLFVYGNYAGDNLNFDMAEELLEDEGIESAHVRVWDDCASAPKERLTDRRGIAGDLFVIKIAGAACDRGMELAEAVKETERARDNVRSIGVATTPGQIPGLDKPTFEIADDEMEYGMGIHGERGIERTKMKPADEIVEYLYNNIKSDMELSKGDEVCVLVNGLGSTTVLEMSIAYRKLKALLDADGIAVHDADINSYCTCQEMGGFSISLLKLDDTLRELYDMPCYCPYYAKKGK
ncbi:dihydroxyacetone kinase subunit DhaK [[Clostridium] hylemonae]|uniref:dihydroxyacetone kinase subunit DhaK n=1 Tax=[Clostridium] hylemonae TaxID=89153 RepID=UPI001FCA5FFA|nr:dihydroxyacetone kinase subunit DhaK [[Clostridium] hylemonae]BDF04924.1 dihydroxyacetone kinase subunit DhaK [[Clostridium] hylemonae]